MKKMDDPLPNKSYIQIKRVLDAVFAAILLVIFGVPMLLIALLIRLDSRGPALYKQERVGINQGRFIIYKFRTMKIGTPVLSTEEMQKQAIKPFTRIGPFLRKTNLDELPQLINILKGEMSFVGPRPALPTQEVVNRLRSEKGADSVLPGITGLAQVMGRDDLDDETKVNYDAEYVQKMSFLFDVKLIIKTFGAVITGRGNK